MLNIALLVFRVGFVYSKMKCSFPKGEMLTLISITFREEIPKGLS